MAVSDYLKAITSEHSTKTNYISFVTAHLDIIQDIENCLGTFNDSFALISAEGAQQDVLGKILNTSRILQFTSTESTGKLDDDDFYIVLLGAVLKNYWDGSIGQFYTIWDRMFPLNPILITDYNDMSVNVMVMMGLTDLQLELLNNNMLVPKSAGVNMTFTVVENPIFAYDMEPFIVDGATYFAGYDIGYWPSIV